MHVLRGFLRFSAPGPVASKDDWITAPPWRGWVEEEDIQFTNKRSNTYFMALAMCNSMPLIPTPTAVSCTALFLVDMLRVAAKSGGRRNV